MIPRPSRHLPYCRRSIPKAFLFLKRLPDCILRKTQTFYPNRWLKSSGKPIFQIGGFFHRNLTLDDLRSSGNRSYTLHYTPSRMRDTYGTHMALMKTPFEYLSTRMGHKQVTTTQKFYIVLRPEIVSQLLSRTVGFKYAKFSEYFFDRQKAEKDKTTQPILVLDQENSLPFGNCTGTYCNFDPRIGCYLCSRFQYVNSRDEHLKNLEWLRQKKTQMMQYKEAEGADMNDPQLLMYFRQLDLAIEGAEFIVSKCTHKEG